MSIIAASGLRNSSAPFIIEVKTDNAGTSNNDQFQFTGAVGDYNVIAKQGGVIVATFNDLSGAETITFSDGAGTYTLEITPKSVNPFNQIQFNYSGDVDKITEIKQFGTTIWSSFENAFNGCENMLVSATDIPNLSSVTNMSKMFGSAALANPNAKNWNVSNVTNMNLMFADSAFNKNINNWDVSNVTNMGGMFINLTLFNQPLNSWNVSSVTNMANMFGGTSSFNQPLYNWDVSNVTNMGGMFTFSTVFNQDLSGWCVTNIESEPNNFDFEASDWVLPNSRPVWGTCP